MRDRRMVIYRYFLWVLLILTGIAIIGVYRIWVVNSVPDTILLRKGKEEKIDFHIPVSAKINAVRVDNQQNSSASDSNAGSTASNRAERYTQTMSGSGVTYLETPVATSVSIKAGDAAGYTMDLKYMGFIPMKSVQLDIVSDRTIAICGSPIGIYVKTEGVLVIDTGTYVSAERRKVSPSDDILQPGDYVVKVDGENVTGKKQFVNCIEKSNGKEMILTILRNGEYSDVKVKPCQDENGIYKIGIWVRDSAQGIGTLSYITADGEFAALGHGVNDADIGNLMELKKGSIYRTNILAVRRATESQPGELTGVLSFDESDYIGKVTNNTSEGIFGKIADDFIKSEEGSEFIGDCVFYPVALKQEVRCGPAQIYCRLEEAPALYDITIDEVTYHPAEKNRGIMLTVTDPQLLEATGGIVQGMSGSPIIQDGKIIGAVTHVLVNDPTRGYGIFIENMLEHDN